MNEDKASAPLRLSIRATIGGTGSGASLRNIITDKFPDGALCFVTENRALYQLDKSSTAVADNLTIVQPVSGPGRWFILSQSSGAASLVAIVGTAENNFPTVATPNFVGSDTSNFTFQPAGVPAGFALTALGGVLTYNGEVAVRARVTFTGSVYVPAESGGTVWAAVDLNSDAIGTDPTTSFDIGTQTSEVGADGLPQVIASQRTLLLSPGDTIQIALGTDVENDLTLTRATLSVQLV
jgi:hypothetical protein